jgi:hypothetical protein
VLIPRHGVLGAALANTIAYATLAAVTVGFSWRVYPIPYEWSRLLRIGVAGAGAYGAALWSVPVSAPPWSGFLSHAGVATLAYISLLYAGGFFQVGELRALRVIRARALQRSTPPAAAEPAQVEMAGEIVATVEEPAAEPLSAEMDDHRSRVSEDSPGSRY